jgi:four helix bundle protein
MFLFEKLVVYKKSVDFVDRIFGTCEVINGLAFTKLKDQLRRASLSVPLNIAEANGRAHKRERRQFYYTSRGSLHECIPILEILLKRKKITMEEFKSLYDLAEEIAKMLAGIINALGAD